MSVDIKKDIQLAFNEFSYEMNIDLFRHRMRIIEVSLIGWSKNKWK